MLTPYVAEQHIMVSLHILLIHTRYANYLKQDQINGSYINFQELPLTGDTESLGQCRQQHQYFFLRLVLTKRLIAICFYFIYFALLKVLRKLNWPNTNRKPKKGKTVLNCAFLYKKSKSCAIFEKFCATILSHGRTCQKL